MWRGWCCWTCVASSRLTSPSRGLPRRVEPLSAVHCLGLLRFVVLHDHLHPSLLCLCDPRLLVMAALYSQHIRDEARGGQQSARGGGRVLIGDEMGHGKALQAWPALVVAPSALRWSHRARESSVMVRSRDGCSMHIASWLQWWSMLYLTKPWLDDFQVRRFLVSRTRLRGDRFLSRGEAPSVLGCPSWKRMSSLMRRWLEDNRR